MDQVVTSTTGWNVSTRSSGEVLAVCVQGSGLHLGLIGAPAGFSAADIENWLGELAGVALDAARAADPDAARGPLPRHLHQALTGLLFYQSELWAGRDGNDPCAIAMATEGNRVAVGWAGSGKVELAIGGKPFEPVWILVRDDQGHDARAFLADSRLPLSVRAIWSSKPGDAGAPSGVLEAEWPGLVEEPSAAPAGPPATEPATEASPPSGHEVAAEPELARAPGDRGVELAPEAESGRAPAGEPGPISSAPLEPEVPPAEPAPQAGAGRKRRPWHFLGWMDRLAGPRAEKVQEAAAPAEIRPEESRPAPPSEQAPSEAADAPELPHEIEPASAAEPAEVAAVAPPEAIAHDVAGVPDVIEPSEPAITRVPDVFDLPPEPGFSTPEVPEASIPELEQETGPADRVDPFDIGSLFSEPVPGPEEVAPMSVEPDPVGLTEEVAPAISAAPPGPVEDQTPPPQVAAPPATPDSHPPAPMEEIERLLAPAPAAPPGAGGAITRIVEPPGAAPAPVAESLPAPAPNPEADSVPAATAEPAPVGELATAATAEPAAPPAAPAWRAVRRPAWPEPERDVTPGGGRSIPVRTWVVAAVVLGLFGLGWLLGRVDIARGGRGLAALLEAVGIGPARYQLVVTSRPAGAWINVDGVDQALRTPATLQLKPGPHDVSLSISGVGGSKHTVRGKRGERVGLDVDLSGTLAIAVPEGGPPVAVSVDGMPRGTAPLNVERLPPGVHRLQFSGPGMAPWEQTVEVQVDRVATIVAQPIVSPATGVLEVRALMASETGSSPLSGAEVWIDGQPRGATPLKLELPRGPHSIRVAFRGEEAAVQVIDLPGGNERFATFEIGLSDDLPRLQATLSGRVPLDRPTVLSASLDRARDGDVRDMWLHVRSPEGAWRGYPMTVMKAPGGLVGVVAFPVTCFDAQGRTSWYVSATTPMGDEYFTEIQTALSAGRP